MKMLRTILLAMLLCGAAVIIFWPRKSASPIPPGRVEIHYWEKWSGREAEQMQQIVDAFNNTVGKEKGIWVSYLSMATVDQKVLLATAAGVPPDVAGMWDTQLNQYAAMGALEPLDEMAKAHGLTKDYYKPVFYEGCSYEGGLYALPAASCVVALHYNKRLFEEKAAALRAAGLDPTRPPRSIAELDAYAKVLDTRDEQNRLVSAGYLPQEPGWWLDLQPYWFGGDLYDRKTRKLTFTDPKVIDSYEWAQAYTTKLGAQTIQQFRSSLGKDNFDSPQSPFFTGAVAMEPEGPWKANYIEKLNPRMSNRRGLSPEQLSKLTRQERRDNCEWGAAAFPSVDPNAPPATYCGLDILSIPSTSQHKKEAFEFIAFVNRQDQMEKLASMHCVNSPLAKVSKEFIENHPNPYVEVFEELANSPNAKPLPPIPNWAEVKAELDDATEKICLGDVSPEAALTEAQIRCQEKLDKFLQRLDQRKQLMASR